MVDTQLETYEKELNNKIALKLTPTKTEEQILYQSFKFFDLEGTGYCNLRDFIKANEKIGVALNQLKDYESIFNYFDSNNCGVIDYRKFSKALFGSQSKEKRNHSSNSHNDSKATFTPPIKRKGVFFDKLVNSLLQNGGAKALISLCAEFKMVDYDNSNRLTIDDFIKIISESKISLSISDIQLLFHSYELYSNGIFYYEEMFKDLKGVYWSRKREKIVSDAYLALTKNNRVICMGELKGVFDPQRHILLNEVGYKALMNDFCFFVEHFSAVKHMKPNYILTRTDFEDFMSFYSFGIDSDEELYDIVSQCLVQPESKLYPRDCLDKASPKEDEGKTVNRPKFQQQLTRKMNSQLNQKEYYSNKGMDMPSKGLNAIRRRDKPDEIIVKLRSNLKQFGKRTLFNLTKHFKYYGNESKQISKYDLTKVIKDFKLSLSVNEIEKLFSLFSSDSKKVSLNYEDFIRSLTSQFLNDMRIASIHQTYSSLEEYANGIGDRVNVDMMKSMYSGRDNVFCLEEAAAVAEFCEAIEVFHYDIKGSQSLLMSKEEFSEFYQMISLLIDDDEDFSQMLSYEWGKVTSKKAISHSRDLSCSKEKDSSLAYSQSKKDFRVKYDNDNDIGRNSLKEDMKEKQRPRTPISGEHCLAKGTTSPYTKTKQLLRPNTPSRQNPLTALTLKLKKRGIRGLMNLHKQFLFSCPNLGVITLTDFIRVLKLQRLDLVNEDFEKLFQRHSQDDNPSFLNFPVFIRAFKQVLNESRLFAVENAFASLDLEQNESLFIEDIKLKYNSQQHPDVTRRIRSEDEVITEFLDCFDLNYNLLTTAENPETSNMVSFEEFANFYEYVSFIYDSDEDFIEMIESTWRLQ